ncbi:hypothetical protein GCM10023317_29990 [Actinopolymorpha pittospori]
MPPARADGPEARPQRFEHMRVCGGGAVTALHQNAADRTADLWAQDAEAFTARLRTWMTEAPGHDRVSGGSTHLDRVPVLSAPEALVVARLLQRLARRCDQDPVTDLANAMAERLCDRLGV